MLNFTREKDNVLIVVGKSGNSSKSSSLLKMTLSSSRIDTTMQSRLSLSSTDFYLALHSLQLSCFSTLSYSIQSSTAGHSQKPSTQSTLHLLYSAHSLQMLWMPLRQQLLAINRLTMLLYSWSIALSCSSIQCRNGFGSTKESVLPK